MNIQQATLLFSGSPVLFRGLSNEGALADACPDEFKRNNPWSDYAMWLFFKGGDTACWKWKSDDRTMRDRQIGCFHGLLGTFGLPAEDKRAVAGWMLSEMLNEVPERKKH